MSKRTEPLHKKQCRTTPHHHERNTTTRPNNTGGVCGGATWAKCADAPACLLRIIKLRVRSHTRLTWWMCTNSAPYYAGCCNIHSHPPWNRWLTKQSLSNQNMHPLEKINKIINYQMLEQASSFHPWGRQATGPGNGPFWGTSQPFLLLRKARKKNEIHKKCRQQKKTFCQNKIYAQLNHKRNY